MRDIAPRDTDRVMTSKPRSRRYILAGFAAMTAPMGVPTVRARAAETYTLRYGVSTTAISMQGLTAIRFATSVNRRSNGQLKIEVYPNGQLAKEQETVDAVSNGIIDIATKSTAWLVQLFPQYQVFDTPFLFKDLNAAFRVLDGPIGDEFLASLAAKNILGLGWGIDGYKEIGTVSKPVTVPDDLKGLRIRVVAGAVYIATFQALGALPITIDSSETFTALSQHTVDGVDNPLNTMNLSKFYTIVKHVAMSNHILAIVPFLASKRKVEALPAPLQKIIREEARAIVPYWRALTIKQTIEDADVLKKNGVAFTEIQYPAFRKAVEPVYAMMQAKVGATVLDRIVRAAG